MGAPAPPRGPAARRSRTGPWAVLAALLIVVVVVGAIFALHIGGLGLGGSGWGSPSTVQSALTAKGLECEESVVLRPASTICQVARGASFLAAGVTTDEHVAYVAASTSHLNASATSSMAAFAEPYFVAAVADGAERGSARSWLEAHTGTTGHTIISSLDGHVLNLDLVANSSTGDSELSVVLDDRQTGGSTPVQTRALPAITTSDAMSHFASIGLSCSTNPPYCDATTANAYTDGSVDPNTNSDAVVPRDRDLGYGVVDCNRADVHNPPGNLPGIVNAPMERNLAGVLGMVFTSPADQQRILAWLTPKLASWAQYAGYRLVVKGIAITLYAFAGNANGRVGFGWGVNVDPVHFDGTVVQA
ncbi:MAG TPA: hypothetical protein VIA06_06515 [Candidatus Dormibacteraeota bacterium]|nr:hypothetical protein [Candidatus Dormibacteraeota bacterium]